MKINRLKKTGTVALALLCAIAIALTGTFAFQSVAQQGWGQAVARDQFPAGRLHIDQEVIGTLSGNNFGEMTWRPGDTANKEIYVENFDELTPIFVRVRLYEYMETGPGAELNPNDPYFAARAAQPLIAGTDRLDPTTWITLIPNAATGTSSATFRDYWRVTQDGGSKWFMPTFNQDAVSREPDVKGDAWGLIPALPELPNATRRGLPSAAIGSTAIVDQPYAYAPEAGLSDYFKLNTTHSATVKTYDWDLELPVMDTTPTIQTAKETLDAEIMTMDEWNTADQPVGDIWVLDTDGWAYWASPLEAGEATGLLMNEMKYTNPVVGTMYYAVYADADLATLSQLPMAWDDTTSNAPMSPEGEDLVNVITSRPALPLMQEVGRATAPGEVGLFLVFPTLRRNQIERLEVIDRDVSDLATFAAGTFNGRAIVDAVDVTHADSDLPVVAFYTAGNTAGRFDVYIAGRGGVAATGSLRYFCSSMSNATTIDLALLDTSRVTNMSDLFGNSRAITGLDLSSWNTSRVTNMSYMFWNTDALTSLDLSSWDTSSVTDMGNMFNRAGLTSVELSGWDTSSVTTMERMFDWAVSLTSVDLSSWDTSSVTNMRGMFANTYALTGMGELSGWDTSSVTNMENMFIRAVALTRLDLSGWDTSSVTNMGDMFYETSSLTSLDLSGWDTSSVTNMRGMFGLASAFTSLDLSGFDTSSVTNMENMFGSASSLISLDLSGFDTSSVTNMERMFNWASALTSLDVSGWDTSSVTNMEGMFGWATALTNLDLSDWDTSSVTNMTRMFWEARALTNVDFRNADFSKVTDNDVMFNNSGINTMTVGSTAARDFIQSAPGWARTPPRTIVIAN